MKELVTWLVRGVVTQPDAVEVNEVEGESSTLIELRVAAADLGRVRGEDGEPLQSIRTVVSASAGRRKAIVELLDGTEGSSGADVAQDEDGPTEELARAEAEE